MLVALVAIPSLAQVDEGDRHWELRAEGQAGGRAKSEHADAAIAAYQRALASEPSNLEARWKLLRALRFRAQYAAASTEEKKKIYSQAKSVGDQGFLIHLGARGLSVTKSSEKQLADAARATRGLPELFLWDAINWGEWALVYGKLAAVREGAADRIRRGATIAMLVDPKLEGGTPSRVLGRLHDQTPRVPFLTGWASSKEAVRLLRESLAIEPSNKITMVFLAEAMVSHDAKTKPQAMELLRRAATEPNPPEFLVENAAAQEEAKALLRKWGG